MSETTKFDYTDPERAEAVAAAAAEDQQIAANPPAAYGDPAGATVADSLEDLFEAKDEGRFVRYPAVAPNGAELILEFDTKLTADEFARYQKLADGNRASRRSKNPDPKPWLSAAAIIAEKCTSITHKASGEVYKSTTGRNLTPRSEEWLKMAKAAGDPINGALNFFGFPQVIALGNAYMAETGLDDELQAVGPTNG